MPTTKNQLLEAALAYARRGLPVTPAGPMVRRARRLGWPRQSWECACDTEPCASPGEHPFPEAEQPAPRTQRAEIETSWAGPAPPNVMISPSPTIDLWDVPREIGALGMRRLEKSGPQIWPPAMRQPNGRWIIATASLTGSVPQIKAHGTEVIRLASDATVLVPPSRLPSGKLRWLWSQRFPHTPLPEAWPVLSALASAADQLHPWEVRDEVDVVARPRS